MAEMSPQSNGSSSWYAHKLMTASQVRLLERRLSPEVRYRMKTRDISQLGRPFDVELELWVHPEDAGRAASILCGVQVEL